MDDAEVRRRTLARFVAIALGVVVVGVASATWPILISTVDGVSRVDPLTLDSARTCHFRRIGLLGVSLRAAVPDLLAGLRIGLSADLGDAAVGRAGRAALLAAGAAIEAERPRRCPRRRPPRHHPPPPPGPGLRPFHTPAGRAAPPAEAPRTAERLEWHYPPTHGSWLNMAELELSVLTRQCLARRIPDAATLATEVAAWVAARNAAPHFRHPSSPCPGLTALVVMAAASGSLLWSSKALYGPLPGAPGGAISFVAASAVICAIAALRCSAKLRWNRVLVFTSAVVGVFTLAGVLVWGTVWIGTHLHTTPFIPGPQHVAVIRTLVVCAFALGLAWSGSKWQRKELAWLAWTVLALGAVKLLFEDLRHGYLAFTATSIFLYAVTLLLVPRLMRAHRKIEHS